MGSISEAKVGGLWKRRLARIEDVEKGKVLVFDGVLRQAMRRYVYQSLRGLTYRWAAVDSDDHAHSVRWKQDVPVTRYEALVSAVHDVVSRVATDKVELVRVYANHNVYGEEHYPHIDGVNCLTALYCANVEWESHWQGETTFFDGEEPTIVVAPKPGRLIVFDGAVLHRGAPPARDCWEPRLNVVFKYRVGTSRSGRATSKRSRDARSARRYGVVRL